MFKQIFTSVALPYRLPSEMYGIPSGTGLGALYNGYLVTPPRLYAEDLDFPLGFFAKRDLTPSSDSTLTLLGITVSIYWPGYAYMNWRFDGYSGQFIDRAVIVGDLLAGSLHLSSVTQAFDGSLWGSYNTGSMIEYDKDTYTAQQTVLASLFGRSTCPIPLVDKTRDIVMMPAQGGLSQLIVYTLSTGAVVRTINLSGAPINTCAEDDKRVYILCTGYILNLVDYTTGEVISVYKCPIPPTATYVMLAYERNLRRLLIFAQVPAASDGSGQSIIRGYYPVPLPTHITAPIPLRPLRRGRTAPVLVCAVGDAGERLSGVVINMTVTGDASIAQQPQATDNNGESLTMVLGDDAGTADLDASATSDY